MRSNPYYFSIYHHILYQIYTGQLTIGDSLGSIRSMCEQYAAGSNTIISVLKILTEDGFIETKQGKCAVVISSDGTFWHSPHLLHLGLRRLLDTYRCTCLLLPSSTMLSLQHFDEKDCTELNACAEKIAHTESIFEFRQLRNIFIGKLLSRAENTLLEYIKRKADYYVMLPVISIDAAYTSPLSFAATRDRFGAAAIRIAENIRAKKLVQARNELQTLYDWILNCLCNMEKPEISGLPSGTKNHYAPNFYLYDFIVSEIADAVFSGVYQAGDFLPPIRVSCQKYGVSLPTVRSAYKFLCDLKVAKTINGRGTQLTLFSDFTDDLDNHPDALLHLARMREAVQLLSVCAEPIASYASRFLSQETVLALLDTLRTFSALSKTAHGAPALMIMGALVKAMDSPFLSEIYTDLKIMLLWGIYLEKRFGQEAADKRMLDCENCLSALEKLQSGDTKALGAALAKTFTQNLQHIYRIPSRFGWSTSK